MIKDKQLIEFYKSIVYTALQKYGHKDQNGRWSYLNIFIGFSYFPGTCLYKSNLLNTIYPIYLHISAAKWLEFLQDN